MCDDVVCVKCCRRDSRRHLTHPSRRLRVCLSRRQRWERATENVSLTLEGNQRTAIALGRVVASRPQTTRTITSVVISAACELALSRRSLATETAPLTARCGVRLATYRALVSSRELRVRRRFGDRNRDPVKRRRTHREVRFQANSQGQMSDARQFAHWLEIALVRHVSLRIVGDVVDTRLTNRQQSTLC